MDKSDQPRPSRPNLPEEYGIPDDDRAMLPWSWAEERLEKAKNYWVCTSGPDGSPHSVPVWAGWMGGQLYFDGHPMTRWGRNLRANPAISVHLESGDEVVMLEGKVEDIAQLDRERAEKLAAIFAAKYGSPGSTEEWIERGLYTLCPRVVIAWGQFPTTLTRWRFDTSEA